MTNNAAEPLMTRDEALKTFWSRTIPASSFLGILILTSFIGFSLMADVIPGAKPYENGVRTCGFSFFLIAYFYREIQRKRQGPARGRLLSLAFACVLLLFLYGFAKMLGSQLVSAILSISHGLPETSRIAFNIVAGLAFVSIITFGLTFLARVIGGRIYRGGDGNDLKSSNSL